MFPNSVFKNSALRRVRQALAVMMVWGGLAGYLAAIAYGILEFSRAVAGLYWRY